MTKTPPTGLRSFRSDNRKSAQPQADPPLAEIHQNPKWVEIVALVVTLMACGAVAQAQAKKIPRIGFLMPGSQTTYAARIDAFKTGLRELGYFEGRNITIDWRFAEGKSNRLPDLAANLVQSKVNVIVTSTTPVAEAARQASRAIPIVMAASADPVGTGLIASLAHPGGNITGLSMVGPESDGRALELLQEAFPKITRVAFLWDPNNAGMASRLKTLEAVGQALRLPIQSAEVRAPADLESTLESADKQSCRCPICAGGPGECLSKTNH
jgi:putative ABC transport system substrate-binding protein